MNATTRMSDTTDTLSRKCITVPGMRLAALIAALANACRLQKLVPRYFFDEMTVEIALGHYRRLEDADAELDTPKFMARLLGGAVVTVVEENAGLVTMIEVSGYDATNGRGLAEEVVEFVERHGSTDTRDLCRFEKEPAPMWSILLVLGTVLAALILLVKFAPALRV